MYAIIKTGGKQYKVSQGDILKVEKLPGKVGSKVNLKEILMLGGKEFQIGTPFLKGVSLECEILAQDKAPKVLVFKKKRRHKYRKLQGHRQPYTQLKINKINVGGVVETEVKEKVVSEVKKTEKPKKTSTARKTSTKAKAIKKE